MSEDGKQNKTLGAYAKTLTPIGVKPFDSLRIAEHIGIDALIHHDRKVSAELSVQATQTQMAQLHSTMRAC